MILVTGAAGFIGSAVAKRFNQTGHSTITIDNLSTGYRENIPDKTVFIEGNCGDPAVVEQLNAYDIHTIVHIAGQSSGELSFRDPLEDQKSNTTSTLLLLKFAEEKGIKRIIYISSMSVYGDQTSLPVAESASIEPKSFYAVGKLASEKYLRIYSEKGIDSVILRLFNVYGPGQNLANLSQGMLSIYLAQALNKDQILVKGSLERFRDLIYIDDVVDLIDKLINSERATPFEIYNVCNGYPVKVRDMIEAISTNLDKELVINEVTGTPGDQFGIFGSSQKLAAELGWKPEVQHKEGIKRMVTWATSQ